MPQYPQSYNSVNPTGSLEANKVDSAGILMSSAGGLKSVLNVTAATVIKASPGRVAKIIINAPGATSGGFALNDCLTTGAAAASNLVWEIAYNATTNVEGAVFVIDFPFLVGIVLSAVPGGSPIVSISYS